MRDMFSGDEKGYSIPIVRITEKLDALLDKNDTEGAKRLLGYWENEAKQLNDKNGLAVIWNELAGLCRRAKEPQVALEVISKLLTLLKENKLDTSVSGATMILNCATTLKALGNPEEAMVLYDHVCEIYKKEQVNDDLLLAGLYNNMATALKDIREYERAENCYIFSIQCLMSHPERSDELAITAINMAHLLHECNPTDRRIERYVDIAWECLNNPALPRDGDYAFICTKCATAFGYFGYFLREEELNARAEAIFGNT